MTDDGSFGLVKYSCCVLEKVKIHVREMNSDDVDKQTRTSTHFYFFIPYAQMNSDGCQQK